MLMAVTLTCGFAPSAALPCPAPAFVPHIFCTCQVSLALDPIVKKSVASIPAVSPGSITAMPNTRLLQLWQPSKPVKDMNSKDPTCLTSFCVKACKCYKSLPNKQRAAGCLMQALVFLNPETCMFICYPAVEVEI